MIFFICADDYIDYRLYGDGMYRVFTKKCFYMLHDEATNALIFGRCCGLLLRDIR
jgi:hypothetical protein